ncbi:hypothetical protein Pen01_23230 [Phytomonospora endophytica]|nr:hypothetical protein Pen01_23230 [Phytomonospora endophytica]
MCSPKGVTACHRGSGALTSVLSACDTPTTWWELVEINTRHPLHLPDRYHRSARITLPIGYEIPGHCRPDYSRGLNPRSDDKEARGVDSYR